MALTDNCEEFYKKKEVVETIEDINCMLKWFEMGMMADVGTVSDEKKRSMRLIFNKIFKIFRKRYPDPEEESDIFNMNSTISSEFTVDLVEFLRLEKKKFEKKL